MSDVSAADSQPGSDREFAFSRADFEAIRELVARRTGICLAESREELVYGRLTKRLRATGARSFAEYRRRLRASDADEFGHCVNALTTNVTSFLREPDQFSFLRSRALPEALQRSSGVPRIRIWSAGCSTGQEPYTLALTSLETIPPGDPCDLRILATDIDTTALARAQAGIYEEADVEVFSQEQRERWFLRGRGSRVGRVRAKDALRRLITFRPLNLMDAWPIRGPFDSIFCRNVVIYFAKSTQRILIDRFADLLVDGGYLFLGHSESLVGITSRLERVECNVYRKLQ